jgi:hypothetical protein
MEVRINSDSGPENIKSESGIPSWLSAAWNRALAGAKFSLKSLPMPTV